MNSKTILVVDDDGQVRRVLLRFLERRGYRVITADGGERALELFSAEKPDLVLLDIIMPGLGGRETLRAIMALDPAARVLMLTAVQDDEIGKECLTAGARDYICKPFDLDQLESSVTVNAFLGRDEK